MRECGVPEYIFESLRRYAHAGVGATLAYPGHFPGEFSALGIRPRSWPRNDLLGTTVTYPDGDRINFGISYDDHRDGSPNEDMYSLHLPTRTVTYSPGLQFELFHSPYANTHRGNKDYLRTVPTPPASSCEITGGER